MYQKIFDRLPTKTQLKEKQARSFDLYDDPLYKKARDALNANMRKAILLGIKSGREDFDFLETEHVRIIFVKSDPNNPSHILECTVIVLGVSRAARALTAWLQVFLIYDLDKYIEI